MCKRCKKLIVLALVLVTAFVMAVPALAAEQYYESTRIMYRKNYLYEHTTPTLYKVPTNLAPTPLPEDLNLDPLAYWEQIIPISLHDDEGVEKTTRPTQEIYQEICQLVNELTDGLTTDSDKFTALQIWVDNNITYRDENRTDNVYLAYERRYGACSEISEILYFMATMAGVKTVVLTGDDHQSTGALDENGAWFGDTHSSAESNPIAKFAYYTDGLDQYYCNLETGKLTKLRTIEGKKKPIDAPSTSFSDVPKDAWFANAVNWAIAEGITDGDGANAFNPYGICTNDHIITFLYRAAGKPAAGSARPSFTIKNAWAADAINWAYSKGFINSNFEENTPCTRATAVDYMWRAFGKPSAQTSAAFTDMAGYGYYVSPVSWAVEQGIVEGTGGNNFSPSLTCNRATIVTMLYRAYSG